MSILDWFSQQKESVASNKATNRKDIPGDLWIKCKSCGAVLYNKELEASGKVCENCGYHFRLTALERLAISVDDGSFKEFDQTLSSKNFLNFEDIKNYDERIVESQKRSVHKDAIISGTATIEGMPVVVCIMDFSFMGGSMGSVVGEKIARGAEMAIKNKTPFIVFTASGGARMQEGIMSLMQMAKTSAVLAKLGEAQLPYIVVLTDPTTGGTTASFAMLGDFHIAEKGCLIGFAGPRVIEQTIRQKLPKGFQRAEYLEEHGFVDMVLERKDIKIFIARLLKLFNKKTKQVQ